MSVEMLQMGSLIAFGLAGLFLVIAVILFIVLNIPALVGELTGATQRKAIEDIRSQNAQTGNLNQSGQRARKKQKKVQQATGVVGTAKLSTAQLTTAMNATTVLADTNATTVLADTNATTVLSYGAGAWEQGGGSYPDGQDSYARKEEVCGTSEVYVETALAYASSTEIIE